MTENKTKRILYILFSVIAGLAGGVIISLFSIAIFFYTGLFGWSDGGEEKALRQLETTTNISALVALLFGISTAAYIIYKMNRPKKPDDDDPSILTP